MWTNLDRILTNVVPMVCFRVGVINMLESSFSEENLERDLEATIAPCGSSIGARVSAGRIGYRGDVP